jgi:hypothetical protein
VKQSDLDIALTTIGVIGAIFTGFIAVSLFAGQHASKAGTMIMKISIAMMLMAASFKVFGTMSESDLGKALTAITTIGIIFGAFIMLSAVSGEHASKVGTMLLKMSGALLLLVGAIAILGLMDPSDVSRGLAAITMLTGCMAALMIVTKYAKTSKNVTSMLTRFIVVIGLMVASVVALSFLEPAKLAMATGAITLLVGVFAALIAATKLMSSSKDVQKTLLLMVGIVAILGGVLVALSLLNPEGAIHVSVALTTLLTSFTASLVVISNAKAISNKALMSVGVMVLVMAALGGLLYLLKDLPVDSTLANAAALSTLLLSMSAACVVLGVVGKLGTSAFTGMGILAALIAGVGAIIAVLGALIKDAEVLDSGIAVLSKIGYAIGAFIGSIVGGLADGVMSVFPIFGKHLSKFMKNLEGFIDGANNIKSGSMKGVKDLATAILSLTATSIVDGIANLFGGGTSSVSKFAKNITQFGDAMVDFSKTVSGKIDEGAVTAAANAGKTLTEMIKTIPKSGGLIQMFTGEHNWKKFNEQIIPFGEAMTAFSETVAGKIDESAVTAASNAGKTLTEMVNTIPKSGGIIQMFTGEHNWKKFNEQIVPFGEAIAEFSGKVAGKIDSGAVTSAATAGKMLSSMADNIPTSGGLKEKLLGYTDWDGFNDGILDFAEALVPFSNKVQEIDPDATEAAVNAGQMLANMASNIPQAGGLKEILKGYTDWGGFSKGICTFASAIVDFSDTVKDKIDEKTVTAAAQAGESLGSMCEHLPKTDDFWDFFKSDKVDWGSFTDGIIGFAKALKAMNDVLVTEVSGANSVQPGQFAGAAEIFNSFEEINIDTDLIQKVCDAGTALAEMTEIMPKTEDFLDWWKSDRVDFGYFNEGITEFAKAINKFNTNITGIDAGQCTSAVAVVRTLVDMLNDLCTDMDTSPIFYTDEIYLDGLKENVAKLGEIVTTFFNNFRHVDVSTVQSKAYAAKTLLSALSFLPGILSYETTMDLSSLGDHIVAFSERLSEFATNLSNIDLTGSTSFVSDFRAAIVGLVDEGLKVVNENLDEYSDVGKELVSSFASGCGDKASTDKVKGVLGSLKALAITSVDRYGIKKDFNSIGSDLVDGFASGITTNTFKAEAAAKTMAEAAISAAREKLRINSPSKVFYSIGSGVIEGFVGAVDDGERTVYGSGSNLAQSVRNGFTKALSKVQDILNNGIDTRPTIRPVLDLSDVESGVGSINGMFDSSPSIGLMSNIRAINSSMNARQNGGNADVVSAIRDLKGTLSKLSGNHYSVNGISYNDESVVSDAIETLVQATRIDRRR